MQSETTGLKSNRFSTAGASFVSFARFSTNEFRVARQSQVARVFRPADRPFNRSRPRTPSAPNARKPVSSPAIASWTPAPPNSRLTPYYYSTYDRGDDEVKGNTAKKVMILGGGPNRIGQGIEFDYCCVHAAFALKEDGFETIMVNSNPETVSTDYDTSDKLFSNR